MICEKTLTGLIEIVRSAGLLLLELSDDWNEAFSSGSARFGFDDSSIIAEINSELFCFDIFQENITKRLRQYGNTQKTFRPSAEMMQFCMRVGSCVSWSAMTRALRTMTRALRTVVRTKN